MVTFTDQESWNIQSLINTPRGTGMPRKESWITSGYLSTSLYSLPEFHTKATRWGGRGHFFLSVSRILEEEGTGSGEPWPSAYFLLSVINGKNEGRGCPMPGSHHVQPVNCISAGCLVWLSHHTCFTLWGGAAGLRCYLAATFFPVKVAESMLNAVSEWVICMHLPSKVPQKMPRIVTAVTAPDLAAVESRERRAVLIPRTQIRVLSLCVVGGIAFSVTCFLSLPLSLVDEDTAWCVCLWVIPPETMNCSVEILVGTFPRSTGLRANQEKLLKPWASEDWPASVNGLSQFLRGSHPLSHFISCA